MRLFVKADKDYADPQRAFSSSELEREKQEPTGRLPKLPDIPTRAEKAVIGTEKQSLKKRKKEMEKAMSLTNDAIDILRADCLKADEGYQAAIGALVDAGKRQNQLEGWVGVRDLAKSLEPFYGADSEAIAHAVGWEAFQEGAIATGGSAAMIDSLIKAMCEKGQPIEVPGGKPVTMAQKAYQGEVKFGPGGGTFSGKDLPGLPASKKQGAKVGVPGGEKPTGRPPGVPSQAAAAVAAMPKKQAAGVSKAVELLTTMAKARAAEMCSGNPANVQTSVGGFEHGGSGPAQTSVSMGGEDDHGGKGPAQTSVSGAAHGGQAPAQQSVSGSPHGGSGPAQTSVSGGAYAGREGDMGKALTSMALPRLPRADAMNFDQWRSATRVLTAGNSTFANSPQVQKHYATGPLTGEVLQQVMADSDERARRHAYGTPRGPVYKSCSSCGRTYNSSVRKSAAGEDLGCPGCSVVKARECEHCGAAMAKSHGGNVACPVHGISA